MRSVMEYLGEHDFGCRWCESHKPGCPIACSYAFFIGVSGIASFLSWKHGWAYDNFDIRYVSSNPREPIERAFNAAGYEVEFIGKAKGSDDEPLFREKILESIRRGRPVIAFGLVGPPEAGLITGYDDGGDVLIGWSFFQDFPDFNAGIAFEPSGEFRKRDWFKDSPDLSLVVMGDKKERPPLRDAYHGALELLLETTYTSHAMDGRNSGLAAYAAWTKHLLRSEDFPRDEALLRQRHDVHNAVVGMVAEARWYGAQFSIQASNPEILNARMSEDLLHAAACYAAGHQLMWNLWELVGGNGNPDAYRLFADQAVRLKMVPIIHEARDKDARAAEFIERALGKL